tara:strand:- start:590 stop:796 length:207 start_codon:yes stop_codon:yes gene_type:complete
LNFIVTHRGEIMTIIEEVEDMNKKSKDYLADVATLKDYLQPIFGIPDENKEVCNVRKESKPDSTRNER